jgi:hypothetical protein
MMMADVASSRIAPDQLSDAFDNGAPVEPC